MQVISGKVQKAKKVVIYGPEGVGKSSLAARFPRPIFIDTEGSTTEMDVERLAKPSSWELMRQQVEWVKAQGSSRYRSLVIDTIDWAEMLCMDSVCAKHGKNGIEDFGYGNGYVYTKEEFGRFLNFLSDVVEAGIHVILVAHAQIIKFEQPDEMGAYDRYQLKLGKKTSSQTAPLVKEWADMVLFINYKTFSVAADQKGTKHKGQGGQRTVFATHHPAWDAKNRHGLPDEFPLDYSYIAHIFAGNTASAPTSPPPAAKTAPPASPPVPPPPVETRAEQAPPTTTTSPETGAGLNPHIPQALRDLMIQHGVQEFEIQGVVGKKGYYPSDTPIANYDPGFIHGVLVGGWQQVFGMIQEARNSIPFSTN
ncbi:ATP-binding protein [Cohnella thailandensis]|uniref:ATP-binding protein n=1 Tax=Cohnella thailandensis TaxID=557557 RepID=A0A841ST35_9BACL|nr:ATP-binding protein [Cohnella thailandensis]MBB6632787.1 ATP-binding protein [Cohnella thailandensis]MBP1975522.1 hypothetical protein [Cohnella thailandensis]